jgi:hypothetical protein
MLKNSTSPDAHMHVNNKPRWSNVQATAQAASPLRSCLATQHLFTMHVEHPPLLP